MFLSPSPTDAGKPTGPTPFKLNYPAYFGNRFTIPADNPMTKEGVELGRLLFYEVKLSSNNTISCSTCHQQKRAFTDGQPFSMGVDKSRTSRNAMSLTNLLWVRNLFWDGRSNALEDQASVPMTDPHEMGQSLEASAAKLRMSATYPKLFREAFATPEITGPRITKALAQFERTLISGDSPYDRYLLNNYHPTASELRGMELFMNASAKGIRNANCGHCHGSPKLMVELFHNNGLDSVHPDRGRADITNQANDLGRFRVPALRNIALTAPYMHDGRFNTLREVIDHYSEHITRSETLSSFIKDSTNTNGARGLILTSVEKESILVFLNMLTDSTFINNRAFSSSVNP